ncbi:PepSY-like domain-containing protein [Mesonia aestuariivivens]|uniref:PepSY-like domain-containing protein n=1 Tax=Mesonia aestuariivivens TaxID=2796128 RepID=A0ABS6W1G7_9FLAO|nr:PepSY-like domain-containing protein [Mesonia aestuariivivens]MBW2961705.1 PepSY-like domain-containing protein [Mesonia aestuariivivens]
MKILKSLFVLLFVGLTVNAQDISSSEVPTTIQSQFKQAYKNATDIEWEKEMNNYKVEFEINRMDYEVWYSETGEQVKFEKEIQPNELPTAVTTAIKTNYSDYSIDDCEMRKVEGRTTYMIELEKWFNEIDVVYNKKGKLLRETK